MKIKYLFIFLSTIFFCSLNLPNKNNLFYIVENQGIISKSKLKEYVDFDFTGYEEKFVGIGKIIDDSLRKQQAGIIQGIKNDTIFDILIAFNENKHIVIENPNSAFYRKDETIYRTYILGNIYTTYSKTDTTCINIHIESFYPFRVDTLSSMFNILQAKVRHQIIREFCNK
jgi:hypothetical protein